MSLPLKEFYPINQASTLLECSVEDLIHWAAIGCMRLYVKVEGAIGILNNHISDDTIDFIINVINETSLSGISEEELERLSPRMMYAIIVDFINKKGIDSINSIRRGYAALTYLNTHYVSEDLCFAQSLYVERYSDSDSVYELIKAKVDEEYHDSLVSVIGFVGIGERNFYNYDFIDYFQGNYEIEFNEVHMPESDIGINLISDADIRINKSDLFILKKDFIRVKDASIRGGELDKKYNVINISNLHKWDGAPARSITNERALNSVIERVSAKTKDAIRVLINTTYPSIKDNPTKIADVLTAEARAQGTPCTFNKSTVSNWLKK